MMQRKGNRFGGGRRMSAPIKVGEEIDVVIEAVGEKGDGMAKVKGFVIFVPNTQKGDSVRIKVTRVLKNVGFAEVLGAAESAPQGKKEIEEAEEDLEDLNEDSDIEESDEEPVEDSEDF